MVTRWQRTLASATAAARRETEAWFGVRGSGPEELIPSNASERDIPVGKPASTEWRTSDRNVNADSSCSYHRVTRG